MVLVSVMQVEICLLFDSKLLQADISDVIETICLLHPLSGDSIVILVILVVISYECLVDHDSITVELLDLSFHLFRAATQKQPDVFLSSCVGLNVVLLLLIQDDLLVIFFS